jgi:hypothetical protein
VTSEGTPAGVLNKRFEHAIRTQDLPMAIAAARDLPAVGLDRAARLLHLMALKRSPTFQRAAARWMARYAAERVPPVDELAEAAEALAEMGAETPQQPRSRCACAGAERTFKTCCCFQSVST